MNKYLKLYESHSQYVNPEIKPNVSYCRQENEVHYNPKGWRYEYLTMIARESGTINFTLFSWADTTYVETFAYSKNDGEWIETQNSDGREENIVISVNVEEGDKIRWKGIANHIGGEGDNGGVFTSTCEFDVQGNIMSLLYGDDFNDKLTLENRDTFSYLFYDFNNENDCLVVNASNLILPATTLANTCYQQMFSQCTSLVTAPLVLPATILTTACYSSMFKDCTSLTTTPVLPATTLVGLCYESMFQGCTSLTTAPQLPATTLAGGCYSNMFKDCTSLTTTPVLPATTLANNCYQYMFSGCTNLTTAPELPATTLTNHCYDYMFRSCTNLNYIKAMFITTPGSAYTYQWVGNIASTGTFVKNSAATWDVNGAHGIPIGWTVQTASE